MLNTTIRITETTGEPGLGKDIYNPNTLIAKSGGPNIGGHHKLYNKNHSPTPPPKTLDITGFPNNYKINNKS